MNRNKHKEFLSQEEQDIRDLMQDIKELRHICSVYQDENHLLKKQLQAAKETVHSSEFTKAGQFIEHLKENGVLQLLNSSNNLPENFLIRLTNIVNKEIRNTIDPLS